MEGWEIAFIVCSAISAGASLLVLLTFLCFPRMRRRIFMQMIAFISISDLIASAFSAIGFPSNRSVLCPLQSFVNACFYKCSWFWTVALTFELFNVVVKNKFSLATWHLHVICWLVPIVLTLLPLSNTRYGRDDDVGPQGWCFLTAQGENGMGWQVGTFIAPLCVSLLFMIYFSLRIYFHFFGVDIKHTRPDIYSILTAMRWYPIAMFLVWGPNVVVSIIANAGPMTYSLAVALNLSFVLATQYGTMVAIIFFTKSAEARWSWISLFCPSKRRPPKTVQQAPRSRETLDFEENEEFSEVPYQDMEGDLNGDEPTNFAQFFANIFKSASFLSTPKVSREQSNTSTGDNSILWMKFPSNDKSAPVQRNSSVEVMNVM